MAITGQPKDFQILFLDMNSFFASVEQQVRPELRNQPVGVAPYTGDSGCIIAASYEAKRRGVKICRISEAKKIIPEIKIIQARPSLYMIYHKEIRNALEKFTPYFEAKSIDEFAIKLTPLDQNTTSSQELAQEIKSAIREKVGDYLSCSVGVGPSVFLAKMAAESKKPDGLTILKLSELEDFYSKLKLTDLTGINLRMAACLNNIGIKTPSNLYESQLATLNGKLGHIGRLWYYRLRGYEVDEHAQKTKTIGHSHVLAPEFRDKNSSLMVLRKLVFKAGQRMRRENYLASGVYLNIGFVGHQSFGQSVRSTETFSDNQTFWQKVLNITKKCSWQAKPMYLAVGAFGLKKNTGKQISAFTEIEKRERLAESLDQINDEYGSETVIPASMLGSDGAAPDRIPFGRPRYEILH